MHVPTDKNKILQYTSTKLNDEALIPVKNLDGEVFRVKGLGFRV